MYRLLMRAFPHCYAFNSVYAMYPFSLPEKTSETLTKLSLLSSYSFDLPKTPPDTVHYVNNYRACVRILSDPETFKIWWGPAVKSLTGRVYMLSGDSQETTDQHVRLHRNIYGAKESFKAIWDCFETVTLDLIKQKAFRLGDFFEMDAVREYVLNTAKIDFSVGNLAFARFFAKLFNFPIKTEATPHGLVTEEELFEILGVIFTFLFFNADEMFGMKLKTVAFAAYKQISDLLKVNIVKVATVGNIHEQNSGDSFMHLYGDNLIRKMLKDGNTVDDVITQILLTAAGVANLSPEVSISWLRLL